MVVWRRHSPAPLEIGGPPIAVALPLYGLGRVPLFAGEEFCLITYSDVTKTYVYRRLDTDLTTCWKSSVPSGGYASAAIDLDAGLVCGPAAYYGAVFLDWRTGRVINQIDLCRRVRGSPVAVGDGRFFMFAGNRAHILDRSGTIRMRDFSQRSYYGEPVRHGECIVVASVHRLGDEQLASVICVDDALEVVWEATLGRGAMPSSETSGLTDCGDRLAVSTPDATVSMIEKATGAVAWQRRLPSPDGRTPILYRTKPTYVPARDARPAVVIVTGIRGEVTALDACSGDVRWSKLPNQSAGVWSPTAVVGDEVIAHSGVFLISLGLDDGEMRWATPVGFDGYTAPVIHGRSVYICGGDPPNDSYAFRIDLDAHRRMSIVSSRYSIAGARDNLFLSIPPGEIVAAEADLRMFGRSQVEQFKEDPNGTLTWRGWVNSDKRLAETVVVVQCRDKEGATRLEPAYIDCGVSTPPSTPSALAMEPSDFPRPQTDPRRSGGKVLEAMGKRYGRAIDPAASEETAEWMKSIGINPHFLWRGGAERQMSASRFPLVEVDGIELDARDVEEVLESWSPSGETT